MQETQPDYAVVDGCLARRDRRGQWRPLATFSATIDHELLVGDLVVGYHISGRLQDGQPLERVFVRRTALRNGTWPFVAWGVDAVARAGADGKSHLARAILALSPQRERRKLAEFYDVSFALWLRGQQSRVDPVGDLARDVAQDRRWPRRTDPSGPGLRRLVRYLERAGACEGAVAALHGAAQEWAAEQDVGCQRCCHDQVGA